MPRISESDAFMYKYGTEKAYTKMKQSEEKCRT